MVTRQGFEGIVNNAFAGFGFPAEAPKGYVFPIEMFQKGSDLTPLTEHMEELLSGLLTWEPEMKTLGVITPEMLTISGKDYQTFFNNVNYIFARNLWRDSLPVIPPTEDMVDWILTGTDMAADTVVSAEGGVKPRGGIATVRDVAIALCMAGGRPEYLPVLIACVQAVTNPTAGMQSWNSTTNSVFPAFVVSGPVAKQIRLGCGYGCLGADPAHPAGQTIGRAVRLIQQNLGGAVPGVGTRAILGGSRSCNIVVAEDDDGVPATWTTISEERGYKRGDNAVMFTPVNGTNNILWNFGDAAANEKCMNTIAQYLACAANHHRFSGMSPYSVDNADLPSGLIFVAPAFAQAIAERNGLTKTQMKEWLWEHSKHSWEDLIAWGFEKDKTNKLFQELDPVPFTPAPYQIDIVVAGGDQGGHGYYLSVCPMGSKTDAKIELPKNWDDLLLDAEIDLGPLPSSR